MASAETQVSKHILMRFITKDMWRRGTRNRMKHHKILPYNQLTKKLESQMRSNKEKVIKASFKKLSAKSTILQNMK